jgi:hypothetical protein
MDGFLVTPEQLAEAAATITAALGDGAVGRPPSISGGGACGHEELAAALAEFGSAVQLASGVLVRRAEEACAGLRAGAQAYARHERRNAEALVDVGERPAQPAGEPIRHNPGERLPPPGAGG